MNCHLESARGQVANLLSALQQLDAMQVQVKHLIFQRLAWSCTLFASSCGYVWLQLNGPLCDTLCMHFVACRLLLLGYILLGAFSYFLCLKVLESPTRYPSSNVNMLTLSVSVSSGVGLGMILDSHPLFSSPNVGRGGSNYLQLMSGLPSGVVVACCTREPSGIRI